MFYFFILPGQTCVIKDLSIQMTNQATNAGRFKNSLATLIFLLQRGIFGLGKILQIVVGEQLTLQTDLFKVRGVVSQELIS